MIMSGCWSVLLAYTLSLKSIKIFYWGRRFRFLQIKGLVSFDGPEMSQNRGWGFRFVQIKTLGSNMAPPQGLKLLHSDI